MVGITVAGRSATPINAFSYSWPSIRAVSCCLSWRGERVGEVVWLSNDLRWDSKDFWRAGNGARAVAG